MVTWHIPWQILYVAAQDDLKCLRLLGCYLLQAADPGAVQVTHQHHTGFVFL